MTRTVAGALLVCLAPLAAPAATLEERVQALENRNAELYLTLEEKKAGGLMTKIGERL